MGRFLRAVLVVAAIMAVVPAPASAAPDEDFVVGNGRILVPNPLFPGTLLPLDIVIDAHSGASGENPSGTFTVVFTAGGLTLFDGQVTCLDVTGERAIIGFDDAAAGHLTIEVMDNSATGSRDSLTDPQSAVGCSAASGTPTPLASGDLVVHDALPLTSKDQCKDGGWRDFTDDEGHPFDNQGHCIAFVQHGP
jgi:hypothetical protein